MLCVFAAFGLHVDKASRRFPKFDLISDLTNFFFFD